jgi:hypothetical protein
MTKIERKRLLLSTLWVADLGTLTTQTTEALGFFSRAPRCDWPGLPSLAWSWRLRTGVLGPHSKLIILSHSRDFEGKPGFCISKLFRIDSNLIMRIRWCSQTLTPFKMKVDTTLGKSLLFWGMVPISTCFKSICLYAGIEAANPNSWVTLPGTRT